MPVLIPAINPVLKKKHNTWKRVKTLIEYDEESITEQFCIKLPNESQKSYEARKQMYARGFVNPTIELLTGPCHTIFSKEIEVETNGAENRLYEFSQNCTMGMTDKTTLTRFMNEQVCPSIRGYGTVFVLVDMPKIENSKTSESYQKENRIWPYVCMVDPLSVINYEFLNGELLWFAYRSNSRALWADPIGKQPDTRSEVRIWTKKQYLVIDEKTMQIDAQKSFDNKWGFVPVLIQAQFKPSCDCILGEAPFFASSNYIIAANDHYSTANIEVSKHSNLTLLLHQDAVIAANMKLDEDSRAITKTTQDGSLIWDGEQKPEYLTKDLDAVQKANDRGDKYMSNAFDNEKSAKSVAKSGYDGSDVVKSGFAMVVERDPIMANITATANDCEALQNNIMLIADKIINNGRVTVDGGEYVKYDKEYELQPYVEFMSETEKFMQVAVSDTAKRERQKKINTREITDSELRNKANDEVDMYDFGEMSLSDDELNKMVDSSIGE